MEVTHSLGIKIVDTKGGFRLSVTHSTTEEVPDSGEKQLSGRFYKDEFATLPALTDALKIVLKDYAKDAAPAQVKSLFASEL
jgi:hypothetical protein